MGRCDLTIFGDGFAVDSCRDDEFTAIIRMDDESDLLIVGRDRVAALGRALSRAAVENVEEADND